MTVFLITPDIVEFDTLTELYDARDADSLTKDTVYRVAWSGDAHVEKGQILTRWDGSKLTPNPLTQVEFPSWLFSADDWIVYSDVAHTVTYDVDGRPILSVAQNAGTTAHLSLVPRYADSFVGMGGRFRVQNANEWGSAFMRAGYFLSTNQVTDFADKYGGVGIYRDGKLEFVSDPGTVSKYESPKVRSFLADEFVRVFFQFGSRGGSAVAIVGVISLSTGENTSGGKTTASGTWGDIFGSWTKTPSAAIVHASTVASGKNTILTPLTFHLTDRSSGVSDPETY